MGVKLYHYTTLANGLLILHDGKLRAKKATQGTGVYLTQVPPNWPTERILFNNYDDGKTRMEAEMAKGKADMVFVFDSDVIGATQNDTRADRNEWMTHGDVDIYKCDNFYAR
ncbi:unnamed protein product [Medioppia subpectinata]|uniref:Uncharacterized protein n=1 Tax=Medioppia subpectinata TaxID=1979941 RepID=A0A7R9Q7L0_9ACAR|nr:unnamed protein product [Medioppia subpectinata]CAG2115952.1 unnamed protein product [Medioppia subpectinata]